jgi:hypothetical protein
MFISSKWLLSFFLVLSRNPVVHFRIVVYATCPAQLIVLHLKFGQFILEYFLSVLAKNMDCSTVFCLLLIYSVESWLICCKGRDLLLRKTRSVRYFAHSVRSVGLRELLELHVDFPNTSVLFDSSEFLLNVILALCKKNSFIAVFCEHCTCISIFFSWFVYCSSTRCYRRVIFC